MIELEPARIRMEDVGTWRWDSALAGWNYRPMARSDGQLIPLDLESSEIRGRWLQGVLVRLPALLGDFAYATEVEVATLSKGERAYIIDWRSQAEVPGLMAFLGQTS